MDNEEATREKKKSYVWHHNHNTQLVQTRLNVLDTEFREWIQHRQSRFLPFAIVVTDYFSVLCMLLRLVFFPQQAQHNLTMVGIHTNSTTIKIGTTKYFQGLQSIEIGFEINCNETSHTSPMLLFVLAFGLLKCGKTIHSAVSC